MPQGNRKVKSLARDIQRDQGTPYIQSLEQAQWGVHVDPAITENKGWNGALRANIAEMWLPIVSRLTPPTGYQWSIVNGGPGWNHIVSKSESDGAVWGHIVHVSTSESADNPEEATLEELCSEDVFELPSVTPKEALSIHALAADDPEMGSYDLDTIAHLDLRQIQGEQERADRIVEFINGYTSGHPIPSL